MSGIASETSTRISLPAPRPRRVSRVTLALLLIALWLWPGASALAKPTTADQAQSLARHWLTREGRPLETPLGSQPKEIQTFRDSSGAILYFVIYLAPDGFVIIPGDDLVEPIIAFAPHGVFDPSEKNPLGALVSRDVPRRLAEARAEEAQAQARGVPFVPTGHKREAQRKWESLQGKPLADTPPEAASLTSVSDLRVAPLVQSHWDQLDDNGLLCYNYYTPHNYYCGCVATAIAQIMYYFQWPLVSVGTPSFQIWVKGHSQSALLRGGDGFGAPYSWGNMVPNPDGGTSDAQRQAIGDLTYDAGVAAHMDYEADGSGAYSEDACAALVSTFGYSNAAWGTSDDTIPTASLIPMINPNLDAALPVYLGIYNSVTAEGHAIVADGYGYDTSTLYHHLNLGWSGVADAWYNLPIVNAGGYNFNQVGDCIYNIYTSGSGEIISGRILNSTGSPVSGATVTATRAGGGAYTATTNAQGIYALKRLPSSSQYTISVAKPGYVLSAQTVTNGISSTSPGFAPVATTGNLWGVNFTLRQTSKLNPILELLLLSDN
jgi:hypothetical protein